ncbi:MAG TPA: PP2C family protein-serine/threonine phosphatase [Phycisphaerales bacterium]|nr:PP2C family protein-serine/threonine phosphatase [Phycisphaerales bacterium]
MTTAPRLLDEFQHEFEQEQTRRLRLRVFWYCVANFGFFAFALLLSCLVVFPISGDWREVVSSTLTLMAVLFGTVYALVEVRDAHTRERTREDHLRRVSSFIAITGIVTSVTMFALGVLNGSGVTAGALAFWQVVTIFFAHCMACLFLPWTWKESLRPFMPMYLINAVGMVALWVINGPSFSIIDIFFLVLYALTSVCAVLPGIGIAYWRHNRFAQEFTLRAVAGRYGEVRRELAGAQRIHEQLFPKPEVRGSIRFDYRYQPMRLIGGDYLYARFITTDDRQEPQLLCLLLDVTGHGIPAALTVNRLYGEIERLIAEDPAIAPTSLLRALNRYCFLTLSDHSLFVTAVVFRLDQHTGTLRYANAGHPPAFVRSGGVVRELEPTAMVLGVAKDLDVEVENPTIPFNNGDTLIAYTDGAMETRDRHGRMLSTEGIRDALVSCLGGDVSMCHELLAAVARHRYGPPSDDTLIVEIARSAPAEPPAPDGTGANGAVSANGHATVVTTPQAAQPANTSAT